jgi:hypothetical protein
VLVSAPVPVLLLVLLVFLLLILPLALRVVLLVELLVVEEGLVLLAGELVLAPVGSVLLPAPVLLVVLELLPKPVLLPSEVSTATSLLTDGVVLISELLEVVSVEPLEDGLDAVLVAANAGALRTRVIAEMLRIRRVSEFSVNIEDS